MNLLNEDKKNTRSKGKKIILICLIISVILTIGIISLIIYISPNDQNTIGLWIDGNDQTIEGNLIIKNTEAIQYIDLSQLSKILMLEYDNSDYESFGTDSTKCYVRNDKLIFGFEQDSNVMYKYEEDTNLDYQKYELKNKIISYNNKLYIALEDLPKALNVQYLLEKNKIKLSSMGYLQETYTEKLKKEQYYISTDQNNQKTLAYGWIIVSKNDLWGVLNTEGEEIIKCKYSSIYFDECNFNYIVSNPNGQYGIISTEGNLKIPLKYDGLEIINYENDIYKVKSGEKYGIIKKDGTPLTDIIYDDIGYDENKEDKTLYTLIIPELRDEHNIVNIGKTIVVKNNEKYGLISLSNGEEIVPCNHLDKIYSINELGNIYYKVEVQKQTGSLLDYLVQRKTQTVNL